MFERATERIIGQYNFDPLQLSLVVFKGESIAVRFQYYSGNGETVIDLPLNSITVEGLESSLQNALDAKAPIKLKFKAKNTYVLHLSRFKKTESEYVSGGFAMLFARCLPIFGVRCQAQHGAVKRFLIDLKHAMYNPAHRIDS